MPQSQIQPRPTVDGTQIDQILALRVNRKALQERLSRTEEQLDDLENQVIILIRDGADYSTTGYQIDVQETARRYPAWRDVVVEKLGKAFADEVLANTPAKVSHKLVIK